jgi:hypothetical protein
MLWPAPAARAEVVHVATSPAKGCVPQPEIVVPPTVNFTVPVGAVGKKVTPLNVAVKVTGWFTFVAPLLAKPSVGVICVTVSVVVPVEPVKFASPV